MCRIMCQGLKYNYINNNEHFDKTLTYREQLVLHYYCIIITLITLILY